MRRTNLVLSVLFVSLWAHGSLAYKFICNGVDADGEIYQDQCGTCNEHNAARWSLPDIPVRVDSDVLPKGLNKQQWLDTVEKGLQAWNKVPGANLNLHYAGPALTREFGGQKTNHEIFWVTDRDEWRRKVGGGERGALGVTVAPYDCPTQNHAAREIYDADLIMNGVTAFPWGITCSSAERCISVLGTLTHELGHFVGLGHPCTNCSWSLMSAQAGFNTEVPIFDDMEGLRALYPGNASHEIGTACRKDQDCNEGLMCETQDDANYCTRHCDVNNIADACPAGMMCDASDNGGVCKFAMGKLAGGVKKGERCSNASCEEGLVCGGSDAQHVYCFSPCGSHSACANGETCMPVDDSRGLCMRVGKLNEACNHQSPCIDGLFCILKTDEEGKCLKPCDFTTMQGCSDGEKCKKINESHAVCVMRAESSISPVIGSTPGSALTGDNGTGGPERRSWLSCSCHRVQGYSTLLSELCGILTLGATVMYQRWQRLKKDKSNA